MIDSDKLESTKILVTKDYSKFKLMKGNRPLNERHVQSLMHAMRQKDLFVPISVNPNMEVTDGQHRLEARKRLKIGVPYYVAGDYGLAEVQALNATQKRWTNEDFADSHIRLGNKDYEIYKWFREKYQVPHTETVALLSGNGHRTEGQGRAFRNGDFKVTNLEGAKGKVELLRQVEPYFESWQNGNFMAAMLRLMVKKCFDFKVFMKKLEMQPRALTRCATIDQYVGLIEDIYNYHAVQKVSLRYGE